MYDPRDRKQAPKPQARDGNRESVDGGHNDASTPYTQMQLVLPPPSLQGTSGTQRSNAHFLASTTWGKSRAHATTTHGMAGTVPARS